MLALHQLTTEKCLLDWQRNSSAGEISSEWFPSPWIVTAAILQIVHCLTLYPICNATEWEGKACKQHRTLLLPVTSYHRLSHKHLYRVALKQNKNSHIPISLEEDASAESQCPPRNNRLFSIWSGDDYAVKEEYYRDHEHVEACYILGGGIKITVINIWLTLKNRPMIL